MRKNLLDQAARMLECARRKIEFDGGKFYLRQDPGQQLTLRRVVAPSDEHLQVTVYEDYPYPKIFLISARKWPRSKVDPETGSVQCAGRQRHDVGTIINPITHQGQIDGAVIMVWVRESWKSW